MTNAFKPTVGKVIATIILLAIGFISSIYVNNLPAPFYLVVMLIFLPTSLASVGGSGGSSSWVYYLISIVWVYFLVCLVTHTINVIRGKNKK